MNLKPEVELLHGGKIAKYFTVEGVTRYAMEEGIMDILIEVTNQNYLQSMQGLYLYLQEHEEDFKNGYDYVMDNCDDYELLMWLKTNRPHLEGVPAEDVINSVEHDICCMVWQELAEQGIRNKELDAAAQKAAKEGLI